MLPIDYHVQHALYNFNVDMKCLKHGSKVPLPAGFWKEQEIVKRITHRRLSKHTTSNDSLTRRGVLFAKANLSSSLSTEEKLSRLSIGIWIPCHNL